MTPSDLFAAAQAHARKGHIDYAVHVARCELCQSTTTWMGSAPTALPSTKRYHACDVGTWGREADMPLEGRRGLVTHLGYYRLTEKQFQECREIAVNRKPSL